MTQRTLLIALVGFILLGCQGPLTAPAFRRLAPEEQAQVDRMWNNMLATPDRLDRNLLLDVMLAYELHQYGVDRATYHAEKDYAGGVVLMDIKYDRQKPLDDWFFVEIRDRANHTVRKEHYSGDEIWSHCQDLWHSTAASTTAPSTSTQPASQPATQATTQPTEAELRAAWIEARYKQIMAATQPVQPTH